MAMILEGDDLIKRMQGLNLPFFDRREDIQTSVYEIVRFGKRLERRHVLNELIFRIFDVYKIDELEGEEVDPLRYKGRHFYRKNKAVLKDGFLGCEDVQETIDTILAQFGQEGEEHPTIEQFLDGRPVDSPTLFRELFGGEAYGALHDSKIIMVNMAFGYGCVALFNYVQRKLNSTGKVRWGVEKTRDAKIFVHTARSLGILINFGANVYEKRLVVLHDLHEDLREYRYEEKERLEDLLSKAESHDEEERIQREIDVLESQIRKPPEYKELRDLLYKEGSIYRKVVTPEEADLLIYQSRLLTKRRNESPEKYVARLVEGCVDETSQGYIKTITGDTKEQMRLYAAPLIAKVGETIDNTNRVGEGDEDNFKKRMDKNIILLREVNKFLSEYLGMPDILEREWHSLLRQSREELGKFIDGLKRDNYEHTRQTRTEVGLYYTIFDGLERNRTGIFQREPISRN